MGIKAKKAAQQPERLTPLLSATSQSCSPTQPLGNTHLPPRPWSGMQGCAWVKGCLPCSLVDGRDGLVGRDVSKPKGGPSPASPTPQEYQRLLFYPCIVRLKNIKPLHCSQIDLATREGIMEEKLHSCMKAVASASVAEGSGTRAVEQH